MCGIVGWVAMTDKGVEDAPRALASIAHRGPDGSGFEVVTSRGRRVGLGHTRLAVLDPSPLGQQPMTSRDGRWVVAFNGEIYNHVELRARWQLEAPGHSDTATLVELLAAVGAEVALPLLNGMFAWVAVDRQEGTAFLVRDPVGVKPLYFARLPGGRLAFASEVRGLEAIAGRPFAVDEAGLQTFLTLRYVPSPHTPWRGIERVAPGQVIRIDLVSGSVSGSMYVEPQRSRFNGTVDDAVDAYRDGLRRAVRRQLLADVPVGVLLSGGVDSALVAAMAREECGDLTAFTVGFAGAPTECEIDAAGDTAAVLGLRHRVVRVSPDALWQALTPSVRSIEEPLGTTSILPMWHLVRRAREEVTVVLTGQGTDEPWGGYRRYTNELLRSWRPAAWAATALASIATGARWSDAWERGLRSLPIADRILRHVEACALFDARDREALSGSTGSGHAVGTYARWFAWSGAAEGVDAALRVDVRTNLADDLLLYGDKVSMAMALEVRVPMIDLELLRFVESLPRAYRVRLGASKIVHRRMAEAFLPRRIVHRKKQGFQVPFGSWIRGPWKQRVRDRLLDPAMPYLGRIDRGAVERIWTEHQSGQRDRERGLFALLTLSTWWPTPALQP